MEAKLRYVLDALQISIVEFFDLAFQAKTGKLMEDIGTVYSQYCLHGILPDFVEEHLNRYTGGSNAAVLSGEVGGTAGFVSAILRDGAHVEVQSSSASTG